MFVAGPRYIAAFPDRAGARATQDIVSLAALGFPTGVIEAWAGAIPGLNQLQLDAINEFGLLVGEHLVVVAPTSSGKTMIGELAALKGAVERKRALFRVRQALVADKRRHFDAVYGAFGLHTIEGQLARQTTSHQSYGVSTTWPCSTMRSSPPSRSRTRMSSNRRV